MSAQPHSDAERNLGGATWAGSVLFGVRASPRFAIEGEPSFGGAVSSDYAYRPGPSWQARVVPARRDTFFTVQVRARLGALEPVAGVSYVLGRVTRHATLLPAGATYFHDEAWESALAVVGGLDAAVRVTDRVSFVPTFRVFLVGRPAADDTFMEDTKGSGFVFRFGAGARVAF